MIFNSNLNLLKAIGNTHCVKLENISKLTNHEVWAKLEFMNPGGSIKDRIAMYMIEKAEKEGKLKPGDTIIENSSGNTAMGLAIVCRQKGYKLKIVIRNTTSKEKIKMLEIMGVDVIKVEASLPPDHPDSYNNFASKLAANDPNVFYIDQHNNLDNNEAHYMSTGPEIWQQMNGRIDYFVAGVGTGGTCTGAGRYLKEKNPEIQVIGVDPVGSIFYDYFKTGKIVESSRYLIEGLGDEFLIKTAQLEMLDDMIQVTDKQAIENTFLLVAQEGILSGGSSGANIYGVLNLAKRLKEPSVICTVICDSGYKYLSTVYNDDWLTANSMI
jgi:cystathionine beta-synthase